MPCALTSHNELLTISLLSLINFFALPLTAMKIHLLLEMLLFFSSLKVTFVFAKNSTPVLKNPSRRHRKLWDVQSLYCLYILNLNTICHKTIFFFNRTVCHAYYA